MIRLSIAIAALLTCATAALAQTPAPAAQPQRNRLTSYPSRPKAPQDVLDRGKATFGVRCAFCHGSDAGGGETGPNLQRSSVVLEDQQGELIAPIVHGARLEQGMPRIDINDTQISEIAAWLHSLFVASRTDPEAEKINIVTGDPATGKAYFEKTCASCHSANGDLKSISTRVPNPKTLQGAWLLPGAAGRNPAVHVPPVTVTVTQPDGKKTEGTLTRIDDFYVGLTTADGSFRSFSRNGDVPKVVLHDPLEPHRKLVQHYTDKDIHDVTAYLVTLK